MEMLLYRVEDATKILNIGRSAIYDLIRSGALKSVKIGGSRRIPKFALEEYVQFLMEVEA
ncbi:MAG TPA: helix-turn-helix domain-containing protein [Pseudonocardiaceae bacterium]|jgi:excisionase family DNA binding protein|nr:helix-turn-helix domain-containing protein [Pseudonocardiaceae bacterium]